MKTSFAELMTDLDEVQSFLAGERKGLKVHVPDEVDFEESATMERWTRGP